MPNETTYLGFRHTTGDASRAPWVGAILVPTGARDLHLASAADEATDWNVANPTHPTLYVHSETTPATDYFSVTHDGTNAVVTVAGGNFSFEGGDFLFQNGQGVVIGHTAQLTISDGDGATNLIPELQVLGTAAADGSLLAASFSTTATRVAAPHIAMAKGGAATIAVGTALTDNEVAGVLIAYGDDGTDLESPVAAIQFVVDDVSGPTTGEMGGSLEFYTTADGGETLTLSFTVNNDQNIYVANGNGIVIGHTAQQNGTGSGSAIPELTILGTGINDSAILLSRFSADTSGPRVILFKSRGATITAGTGGIVESGDTVGLLEFAVDDGAVMTSNVAIIQAEVDGTPGSGDAPGRLLFATTADGSASATERVRIASTGLVTIAAGSTPASVASTPGTAHAGSITATGGLGGNTSIATTGVGGIGGGFIFTGGAGGTANSATTAATGGAGGAWVVTTGAGAAAAVAGTTSTGGAGGAVTMTSGNGGAVSLAVSGTATGGAAGLVTIQGGVGGAVTATTGTNVGGAGGGVSLIAGAGGAASGATDTGGAGGSIILTAGAGGTGDANADGAPGNVRVGAGIFRHFNAQTIDMGDVAVTLTLVPGSPAGTLITSNILYVDPNSGATENLLLPPEADWNGGILVIVNTGGETINIQNDAGGAILTLETTNTAIVTNDGTTLRGIVGLP